MNDLWAAIQGIGALVDAAEIVGGFAVALMLYLFQKGPFPYAWKKVIRISVGVVVIFLLAFSSLGLLSHINNPFSGSPKSEPSLSSATASVTRNTTTTPTSIPIVASSSPTQSVTPTEGISLSPTPTTSASSILYQADWSTGKAGWSAPSTSQSDAAWSVNNGELVSNGQTLHDPNPSGYSTIQAPYQPGVYGIQDYAVEAKILVKSEIPNEAENAFGIGVRRYFDTSLKQDQGYGWRVVTNTQNNYSYMAIYLQPTTIPPGGSTAFNPDNVWHTYRIEVRGSDITVFVDKKPFLHVIDGSFTHGGKVEIWEEFDQVIVHSFIISRLSP